MHKTKPIKMSGDAYLIDPPMEEIVKYNILDAIKKGSKINIRYHDDADGLNSALITVLSIEKLNPKAIVTYEPFNLFEKKDNISENGALELYLDIQYQIAHDIKTENKKIIIDHHIKTKEMFNDTPEELAYCINGTNTATNITESIFSELLGDYRGTIEFLKDVSAVADNIERQEDSFTKVEYNMGGEEFRKFTRMLTEIASKNVDFRKDRIIKAMIKQDWDLIKGYTYIFDEKINIADIADAVNDTIYGRKDEQNDTSEKYNQADAARQKNKSRLEIYPELEENAVVVKITPPSEIPNGEHIRGIIATEISKKIGKIGLIVLSEKGEDYIVSIRELIPPSFQDFMDDIKSAGENSVIGGRDGAWGCKIRKDLFGKYIDNYAPSKEAKHIIV